MGTVERVHITQVYANYPEQIQSVLLRGTTEYPIHILKYTIPLPAAPSQQQKLCTGSVQDNPAAFTPSIKQLEYS